MPAVSTSRPRQRAPARHAAFALLGVVGASLLALAPARANNGNIVLGSGLGAVAGAIIGHSVGGRDGMSVAPLAQRSVAVSLARTQSYRNGPPPRAGGQVVAPYPSYPAYTRLTRPMVDRHPATSTSPCAMCGPSNMYNPWSTAPTRFTATAGVTALVAGKASHKTVMIRTSGRGHGRDHDYRDGRGGDRN